MPPPPGIYQWITQKYPRPKVDPEWLEACCNWITEDKRLDPVANHAQFTKEVEGQLLSSELQDSMLPGSGLPANLLQTKKTRLGSQPVLVEISSTTEIGNSAFSLLNTRQARIEREDLAGLVQREREQGIEGANADEEEDGPIPRYPRQMLKFEISDGSITLPAVEYRKIAALQLDATQLGCKMLVKDVLVRNGIAFLEPSNVVIKGHCSHERDARRDFLFVRSLHRRMGLPDPLEEDVALQIEHGPPVPPPVRGPLHEIPEPEEPDVRMAEEDADLPHARRRLPINNPPPTAIRAGNNNTQVIGRGATPASTLPLTGSTLVPSPFFNAGTASSSTSTAPTAVANPRSPMQAFGRFLSPVGAASRIEPIDIADSSSDSILVPSSSSLLGSRPPASTSSGSGRAVQPQARARQVRDEFDLSSDVDEAFLEDLNRVEQAAIAAPPPSTQPRTIGRSAAPASAVIVQREVIDVDDDIDDDKENVPIPRRRVRRRIDRTADAEVIELSSD